MVHCRCSICSHLRICVGITVPIIYRSRLRAVNITLRQQMILPLEKIEVWCLLPFLSNNICNSHSAISREDFSLGNVKRMGSFSVCSFLLYAQIRFSCLDEKRNFLVLFNLVYTQIQQYNNHVIHRLYLKRNFARTINNSQNHVSEPNRMWPHLYTLKCNLEIHLMFQRGVIFVNLPKGNAKEIKRLVPTAYFALYSEVCV